MSKTGIIILAHGSRGELGIVETPERLTGISEGIKNLLPPGLEVIGAALRFNHPDLEEAVASLVDGGVQRIVILPFFLFSGRHITEDLPQLKEMLESKYPEVQFMVTNALGNGEHFVTLVANRLEEATPELWTGASVSAASAETIEEQSMKIVEKLLPPTLKTTSEERLIVKRVVHASGDPQIASLMKFSPSAVQIGVNAITEGSPIITDVRMVAVGINRQLAEAYGCSIACSMEETIAQGQVKKQNVTRAAAAMHSLGKRLNGAIVVIGNAPTALLALLEMVDNDGIKPALIVGMPVGFVQARESKVELIKREVPYITIIGTRGGSAMAAATINAMLKMAVARNG